MAETKRVQFSLSATPLVLPVCLHVFDASLTSSSAASPCVLNPLSTTSASQLISLPQAFPCV